MRLSLLSICWLAAACGSAVPAALEDAHGGPADLAGAELAVLADGATCVAHAPSADAAVYDVPPPTSACNHPKNLAFYGDAAAPPASLQIVPGRVAHSGGFEAYADHGWAPIIMGQQGGIHIPLSFRVDLPGQLAAVVKLQVRATVTVDCQQVGLASDTFVAAVQATGGEFAYRSERELRVIFTHADHGDLPLYCGRWVRVRLQVKDTQGGSWGETERTLRLYSVGLGP